MNTRAILFASATIFAAHGPAFAANIDRATITEIVNSVSVIEPATKRTSTARAQQIFIAPNVMRTGPNSRAEMVAPDQTVTRVGQNTLFSFEPNSREIDLQKGSILFNSPNGKGGGTVRTPAASAAVLGTTIIVTTTKNGGFKVLVIEGKGRVKAADGSVRILRAGELVYLLPGGRLSGIFEFRLSQQVGGSTLIRGFKKDLPSSAKITAAISQQEQDIAGGAATATNLLAGGSPDTAFQVDIARDAQIESVTGTDDLDSATAFQNAISTDAIVTAPELDPARQFGPGLPEQSEFASGSLPFLVGDPGSDTRGASASNPVQFFGNNILFSTSRVSLSGLSGNDVFQFAAINDIRFEGSVDFGSFGGQLQLVAGGGFQTNAGSAITAEAPQFILAALGSDFPSDGFGATLGDASSYDAPFVLSDIEIRNIGGDLQLFGGDISLRGVLLGSSGITQIAAFRDLTIEVASSPVSSFSINGIDVPPGFSAIGGKEGARLAAARNLSIQGAGIGAPDVRVRAGGDIKMQRVRITDFSNGRTLSSPDQGGPQSNVPPTASIVARNLVELRRVDFLSRDVFVQGNTVSLSNVSFGGQSRVILESRVGQLAPNPNTGQPVRPGFVNFIDQVRYGGGRAENFVIPSGSTQSGGPGIIIRPR